ncbi:MAG: polysulfide reductase, partial [Clostridia bacterium]|nr:polysulfide reductase [Clostridia bacterium]
MTNQKLIRTIALILICVGLIGVLTILIYGEKYQGVSDMVPWGSLISIYIFFAASSVGLTLIASLWYIFKIPAFKVLTKRA